jgi:trans-aconitate methyltransferase
MKTLEFDGKKYEKASAHQKEWGTKLIADRFFPDVEAIVKGVDQPNLVPFLAHVPETDRGAFRDVVVRRMIEETKQADGRCFETFRRINVSGTK